MKRSFRRTNQQLVQARRTQLAKALPGLVDAGSASASTLIAGIVAARILPVEVLGAYALAFSLAILAGTVPQQLIGLPARARLIDFKPDTRVATLAHTIRLALPFAAISAGLATAVYFALPQLDHTTRVALAATGGLYAAALPLSEHARALFHLGRHHWSAGLLSVLRLLATGLFAAFGVLSSLPPALVPLGSLAAADIGVVAIATLIARRMNGSPPVLDRAELARSGRWLLAAAAMGPAAGFLVNLLVAHLAGTASLGFAEGARIVAQPVLVLAVGLAAVSGPGVMEAAKKLDVSRARHIRRSFNSALTVGAILMAVVSILPESVNPVMWLVPVAYRVPGLVLVSIAAALFNGVASLQRTELVVAAHARSIGSAESVALVSRVMVGLSAAFTKAWAVPLSLLAGGVARAVLLTRYANRIYKRP